MDLKQLKASLQLCEMRLKSDPSDANKALAVQAKEAYEKALNPETPKKTKGQKKGQVSQKSENDDKKEELPKEPVKSAATAEIEKPTQTETDQEKKTE